jgi:hypothetical protein
MAELCWGECRGALSSNLDPGLAGEQPLAIAKHRRNRAGHEDDRRQDGSVDALGGFPACLAALGPEPVRNYFLREEVRCRD